MEKITFDFKNRTAIVTGGAQGFGFDITKRFLKSGAKVIIWDNDTKALESAIKEIDNPSKHSKHCEKDYCHSNNCALIYFLLPFFWKKF